MSVVDKKIVDAAKQAFSSQGQSVTLGAVTLFWASM
jgi:hypothetical protein